MHFNIDVLPPNGQKVINIAATVETTTIPVLFSLPDSQSYLVSENYVEHDAVPVMTLAAKLKAKSPQATSQKIYDWVAANVQYAGFIREDRGALYALKERKGGLDRIHVFKYGLGAR